MFNFNGLTIYNECKYRKNLDAERYVFCTTALKDYFGKNVRIMPERCGF